MTLILHSFQSFRDLIQFLNHRLDDFFASQSYYTTQSLAQSQFQGIESVSQNEQQSDVEPTQQAVPKQYQALAFAQFFERFVHTIHRAPIVLLRHVIKLHKLACRQLGRAHVFFVQLNGLL